MTLATKLLARLIGSLNVAFFLLGLCYFSWQSLYSPWRGPWTDTSIFGFLGFAIAGFSLSLASAIAGVHLIQGRSSAARQLAAIYIAELVYLLVIGFTWVAFPTDSLSKPSMAVGLWGFAESFLAPQFGLYYPVFGLCCLLILVFVKRRGSGGEQVKRAFQ